ncbi:hypothetical protein R9X47_20940 [Wukongibacter baidiensis]|uniref:hypothetical protein n=1 Tax=Wukongibacter baidiensis TaxID=1723361 RepID=UPI003D7F8D77
MNRKQVLVLSLSALISLGGIVNGGASFAAQPNGLNMQTAECEEIKLENVSFEDFMKTMPTKDIPKDDMKKLEDLYKESIKLEKDEKWDDANEKWDEFYKLLDKYFDDSLVIEPIKFPSFEDFMKEMPTKDIPKDDMTKLKDLYQKCVELEKDEKWDDASEKWDEFYKILDKYFDDDDKFEPIVEPIDFPTFEEFMKDMPEDVSKNDMKKLEKLYDECVKLEKDDKFDKAYDKWEEFYEILDKYFEKEDMEDKAE